MTLARPEVRSPKAEWGIAAESSEMRGNLEAYRSDAGDPGEIFAASKRLGEGKPYEKRSQHA
jgi:hypothetical protein